MKRVVVTGYGIVSSIGNNANEVLASLKSSKSGISFDPSYEEQGFRSCIAGNISLNLDEVFTKKERRFLGPGAAYAIHAMREAVSSAELPESLVSNDRTGIIMGSGGSAVSCQAEMLDILEAKGAKRVGPFFVPKIMGSTCSASAAVHFKIRGFNYSISSACATSAHCIGNAMELIQSGKQDIVFAGGGEEVHWSLSVAFDAMGALCTGFNDSPEQGSRPFDVDRSGFVISGGGGVLVLEEYEHAKKRSAPIIAEVVGYGASSDGSDMVAPSGEGAERCIKMALGSIEPDKIDYINAHGTSTPVGDVKEMETIRKIFGEKAPVITSTKSQTGHALGAAGVHEAIYSLLMMQGKFIAPTLNVDSIDPAFEDLPVHRGATVLDKKINYVLSNSFGFGGTNSSLIFKALDD